MMRTVSRNPQRTFRAEDYFERKSRELIVPEDEIEAWELDSQELSSLGADSVFDGPSYE